MLIYPLCSFQRCQYRLFFHSFISWRVYTSYSLLSPYYLLMALNENLENMFFFLTYWSCMFNSFLMILNIDVFCSCTISLAQIRFIRPGPKAQLTINIRRGWVKELSLSESIRSDTWIALFTEEAKHLTELLTYISISLVPHTVFFRPLL